MDIYHLAICCPRRGINRTTPQTHTNTTYSVFYYYTVAAVIPRPGHSAAHVEFCGGVNPTLLV